MKGSYFISLCIILILFLFPVFAFAQPGGSSVARQYGKGYPFKISDLPPGQLRWALESLPPQAKSRAMEQLNSFSFPHQDIEHLRVDKDGGIFYVDPFEFDNTDEGAAVAAESAPPLSFDLTKALLLHSRPGSPNKVFLNFEGGVISGTAWSSTSLYAVPYDTDGNPAVLSDAERRVIADIWHRIVEDYAPFDIDVTTERPASFGPKVGHVMVTKDTDANGAAMPYKGAGGVAYVGVWGYSNYATSYSPAFVYFNNLGTTSAHNISEAASHEFGHNLGLSHDGTPTAGYYSGHGTGNVSWGPIMGVGYYTQVTQWSKGEYPNANNTQDDIAIIAGKLTYQPDDNGDTMATATMLTVDADGTIWSSNPEDDPDNIYPENKGVIERAADVDLFAFDHGGGAVSFTVTPAWEAFYASKRGANLDIEVTLYDSQGNIVAISDPVTDTNASVSVSVSASCYYLGITGVGNSVTPYSDYGSLGQYFINGTVTICLITYYRDADSDGYGDSAVTTQACSLPSGHVTNNTDCDDTDPLINPDTIWYPDADGDVYGNPSVAYPQCNTPTGPPGNFVLNNTDPDDSDPDIYPGGPPVRDTGTGTSYYTTLQAAYNASAVGDTIQSQSVSFTENLNINLNKSITLQGGYNDSYTAVTGETTLNGNMTISDGTVTIENFILQ